MQIQSNLIQLYMLQDDSLYSRQMPGSKNDLSGVIHLGEIAPRVSRDC